MKLAIYFENRWYTISVMSWGFLTNHARVLLCVARDPGVRLRDIASSLDITERSAHGFVTDLTAAGYVVKQKDGRRNRYQIQAHMPLREPASQEPAIGEVLALLAGTRTVRHRTARASDRDVGDIRSAEPADAGRSTSSPAASVQRRRPDDRAWLGRAGHWDMVRNEEERDGGAATRRPIRARRRGRYIPAVAGLAWSRDFWVDVAGS